MAHHIRVLALVLSITACSDGAQGPAGPVGPPGTNGTMPIGYLNVLDFGARSGDPAFDNTASFQRALDSAERAGGGAVWVPVGRFFFAGDLSVGRNVELAGAGVGPYDPGPDPATTTVAPTLLATSTAGAAFISIDGENSALQDLLIRYPNQVAPDAPGVATTGPHVYPPTIQANFPSKIYRCSLENSYIAIEVNIGRVYLENLHLGGFKNDIIIDNAEDVVHLSHIMVSVFGWDKGGVIAPSPLDQWVMNHGVALTSYRADALVIEDLFIFLRETGIAFLDSPLGYGATYGLGSDIQIDGVQYGVIAKSVAGVGFQFSNINIGATGGVNMIWLPSGGAQTPHIVVDGGSTWGPVPGFWAQTLKVDAGTLLVENIQNLNPIGSLPALGLTAPLLPLSGVDYVSALPAVANVSIAGGTVQDVRIGGVSTGLSSGMFEVAPGQSIGVVYTSAPTWQWFLE